MSALATADPPHDDEAILALAGQLRRTQEADGAWRGDYSGPGFLLPMYVTACHVTHTPIPDDDRAGMVQWLRATQRADGSWPLGEDGDGTVFTTVLAYVALRLLDVAADDTALCRARAWFLPRGGAAAAASWGKVWLAILGLAPWTATPAVPPEAWLLPAWVPVHPARLWCHARMVYLPMSWLWGRRAQAPLDARMRAVRDEIVPGELRDADWVRCRHRVADEDARTPRTRAFRAMDAVLQAVEPRIPWAVRQRALSEVRALVAHEDAASAWTCLGPVNKLYDLLVAHFDAPESEAVRAHRATLATYLYRDARGVRMNGYTSSALWDAALTLQAVHAGAARGAATQLRADALDFLIDQQLLTDPPAARRHYRDNTRGGWPFSTRESGWPVSDCTAEALTAWIGEVGAAASADTRARWALAVDFILAAQNAHGGWSSYEPTRGAAWLEALNPSDVFAEIMIDHPHVECTASCIVALTAYASVAPDARGERIAAAVRRGAAWIRTQQRDDGGFVGGWGVCFTYGTWFAVRGLRAAGASPDDPVLRRAATFLRAHRSADGGWGEDVRSCAEKRWIPTPASQVVQTAWALLALRACGEAPDAAILDALGVLRARQRDDGDYAREGVEGVFNHTCGIRYDAYRRIFPLWALSAWGDVT